MSTIVTLLTFPIFVLVFLAWFRYKQYKEEKQQNEEFERQSSELDKIKETQEAHIILMKKILELLGNPLATREDFSQLLPICRWQDEIYDNMLTLEEAQRFQGLKDRFRLEPPVANLIEKMY